MGLDLVLRAIVQIVRFIVVPIYHFFDPPRDPEEEST